jgi:hypothetical protein
MEAHVMIWTIGGQSDPNNGNHGLEMNVSLSVGCILIPNERFHPQSMTFIDRERIPQIHSMQKIFF